MWRRQAWKASDGTWAYLSQRPDKGEQVLAILPAHLHDLATRRCGFAAVPEYGFQHIAGANVLQQILGAAYRTGQTATPHRRRAPMAPAGQPSRPGTGSA